VKEHNKLGEGF